ncbi:histidinol-phosphatase HisJ family protein [Emergencia sp. JLR.KK010]|uniref:histidinol-phosphatase HisJ family protein n=1 Tax=Emergencia sp. JLR.KK010 TaxID=3114296 RepID=UPI0030D2FB95
MISDMHVHTCWSSDSSTPVKAQIEKAIQLGMRHICITDHQDYDQPVFPPDNYSFLIGDTDETKRYLAELAALKETYTDRIEVLAGVELGLQPHIVEKLNQYAEWFPFDFVIGSTHNFRRRGADDLRTYEGKSTEEICKLYFREEYENIKNIYNFDVAGHLDFIFRYAPGAIETFSYGKYADELDAILKELIASGRGIEVNTSRMKRLGLTNPKEEIIRRYAALGGEIITFGSDAHTPDCLGSCFRQTEELVKACGLRYFAVYKNRKPVFYPL